MKITVHYTAQLRVALGKSFEICTVAAPANLDQFLNELVERHASHLAQVSLNSPFQLRNSMVVCVNDCQVREFSQHILQDGDQVTLLAAISGG